MTSPHAVTTVVLRRDGLHHVTVKRMSSEDAHRWAEQGFHVFQIALQGKLWAIHYVNEGRVMSSDDPRTEDNAARAVMLALTNRGGG